MIPRGSITLPLDLLIFWPYSSRTRHEHKRPERNFIHDKSPIICIAAKKRMSEPVHKNRCRIEGLKQLCLVRPAHCWKRPQGRAEPCVKNVIFNRCFVCFQTMLGFTCEGSSVATVISFAISTVPCRDLMPHQICLDIHQSRILYIHSKYVLLQLEGIILVFPFQPRGDCLVGKGFTDKPLVQKIRLNDCLASVAMAYCVYMWIFLDKKAWFLSASTASALHLYLSRPLNFPAPSSIVPSSAITFDIFNIMPRGYFKVIRSRTSFQYALQVRGQRFQHLAILRSVTAYY